ncbi:leucine-rich repeat domain-containing protein [Schlesneria paludicola]|uniref:leucine-rich repeat domain-containing protein n=1 Tax=Schlesneria paludicola TaxID=360056 RepID=UPI0002E63140|nr:hypothetical protein [Schlesneria paludicola]
MRVAEIGGVEIAFDTPALEDAKLDLDRLQNVSITDVEFGSSIKQILMRQRRFSVIYKVQSTDNSILITTMKAVKERAKQRLPKWIHEYFDSPKLRIFSDDDGNVVSLSDYGVLNDKALAKFSVLSTLRGIQFEGAPQFTVEGLSHLSKLTNLERLSASFSSQSANELGDATLRSISEIESLRELNLSECGVTDEGLKSLEKLPNLTHLSIYQEGRLTDAALSTIAKLKHLKVLTLTTHVGTPLGRMHFSESATNQLIALTELEHLDLSGHDVSTDLLNFPRLKSLRINRNQFDDDLAKAIAKCRELTHLDVSCSEMTDTALEHLRPLPSLTQLHIRAEEISDNAIAHLKLFPNLASVTLHTAELTDKSLEYLSQTASLTKLDLNWATNHFSRHGLEQLANLPNLETLELRIIPFQGGGLKLIRDAKEPEILTTILPRPQTYPILSEEDRERVDIDLDSLALQIPLARIIPLHDYMDHRK